MYNALCYLQLYLKIYDSEIKYMQMNVYTLNLYDSETKYIKYRQNIEGNDSFRM